MVVKDNIGIYISIVIASGTDKITYASIEVQYWDVPDYYYACIRMAL
jgi:hypothetical protein